MPSEQPENDSYRAANELTEFYRILHAFGLLLLACICGYALEWKAGAVICAFAAIWRGGQVVWKATAEVAYAEYVGDPID